MSSKELLNLTGAPTPEYEEAQAAVAKDMERAAEVCVQARTRATIHTKVAHFRPRSSDDDSSVCATPLMFTRSCTARVRI